MMTELMNFEEFSRLSSEEQKETMEYWRKHYKTKEIRKALGFDKNTVQFYKLLRELGIPLNSRGQGRERKGKEEADASREPLTSNLSFSLYGLYEGRTISEQLHRLSVLLRDDTQQYRVKVEIDNH